MRREVLTYELSAARVRLAILRLGVLSLKRNFNPNEPRIPAGQPGGGRWTRIGGGGSTTRAPHLIRVAANGRGGFTWGGSGVLPHEGVNPLDPAGLNTHISREEGQKIVQTLNTINTVSRSRAKKLLNVHRYNNFPSKETGAVLPLDPLGYDTYYVDPGGSRGRLVVGQSAGTIYYTGNHYDSFYRIIVQSKRGD